MKAKYNVIGTSQSKNIKENDFNLDLALTRMNKFAGKPSVKARVARKINAKQSIDIENGAMTSLKLANS